jgi:hypothetical protein
MSPPRENPREHQHGQPSFGAHRERERQDQPEGVQGAGAAPGQGYGEAGYGQQTSPGYGVGNYGSAGGHQGYGGPGFGPGYGTAAAFGSGSPYGSGGYGDQTYGATGYGAEGYGPSSGYGQPGYEATWGHGDGGYAESSRQPGAQSGSSYGGGGMGSSSYGAGRSRQQEFSSGQYGPHGSESYGRRDFAGHQNWGAGGLGGPPGEGLSVQSYGSSGYGLGRAQEGQEAQRVEQRRPHRAPKGYQRSDQRIYEDLCDRLTDHPRIDPREMSVRVQEGSVTLEGSVHSRLEKYMAEDLADSIPGVKEVISNLRIEREPRSSSPGDRPTDVPEGSHMISRAEKGSPRGSQKASQASRNRGAARQSGSRGRRGKADTGSRSNRARSGGTSGKSAGAGQPDRSAKPNTTGQSTSPRQGSADDAGRRVASADEGQKAAGRSDQGGKPRGPISRGGSGDRPGGLEPREHGRKAGESPSEPTGKPGPLQSLP